MDYRKLILTAWIVIAPILTFGQSVHYVSPRGDDANTGQDSSSTGAWKTWGKAFNNTTDVQPGDTVYFMKGVYYKDRANEPEANFRAGTMGYAITVDGTVDNMVVFSSYPGQTREAILDCGDSVTAAGKTNYGIYASNANYLHFYGLVVRNSYTSEGEYVGTRGWSLAGGNTTIENCLVYNTHGSGFHTYGGNNLRYLNCDTYNNSDHPVETVNPGNTGTGFSCHVNSGTDTIYYTNCRTWKNGDQGWAATSSSLMIVDNCWSLLNGIQEGGGHGFKLGFITNPNNITVANPARIVKNSIAAYNRATGFTTNDNAYDEASTMYFYNNIAFRTMDFPDDPYAVSGYGFWLYATNDTEAKEYDRIFRNNISYDNETSDFSKNAAAFYTHSNNTWDGGGTVTAADFANTLDSTLIVDALLADRSADGSLPEFIYFDLAEGSDLIDAGTATISADFTISSEDYEGTAPDIGTFEYGTSTPPVDPPAATKTYKPGRSAGGTSVLNGKVLIF